MHVLSIRVPARVGTKSTATSSCIRSLVTVKYEYQKKETAAHIRLSALCKARAAPSPPPTSADFGRHFLVSS